jgi:transposase/5-methylcytosine-specific restriction endonuclease McrA
MNKVIIEKELLFALYYGNECTYKEIAEILNCSLPTIISKMKEYKLISKTNLDSIEIELLYGLYLGEELTIDEIAKMFNCSNSFVINQLNKNNIDRRKLGWKLSGVNNNFYGKHHSDESKRKIAKSKLGKKQSLETIEKRIESRRGYKHSEETKKKIGENQPFKGTHKQTNTGITHFKKGCIPWNKNKHHTEETKKKISISNTGKLSGEKCHLWKGGITERNYKERIALTGEEKKWRKKVYNRDDYSCQICHDRSQKGSPIELNAHHIKSWKDYPESRFDINNGITLCKSCHLWIHHLNPLDFQ